MLCDEHGLPAAKMELPEELWDELDHEWNVFVEERAVASAKHAYPEPVKEKLPTLLEKQDRTMSFKSFLGGIPDNDLKDDLTVWMGATSLMAIASTFWLFLKGLDDVSIPASALLLNPIWWSLVVDAAKKKGRSWITIPLFWIAFGIPWSHWGDGGYLDGKSLGSLFLAFLFFLPTKLAWFWFPNSYERKKRAVEEQVKKIEERHSAKVTDWKNQYDVHLAKNRQGLGIDPAVLLDFLRAKKRTLWKKHTQAWTTRLGEITEAMAEGRVRLTVVKEHESDLDAFVVKEAAFREAIRRLEAERAEIIALQDQVTASTLALERVAERIAGKLKSLKADEELEAWLVESHVDHEASKLAIERSRLELQAAVVWFQDQLRHQDAVLEAALEDRPVLPDTTAARRPSDEDQREAADLEVAKTVIDRK